MAIYTRFGTLAKFTDAIKKEDGLYVRAYAFLSGQPVARGRWVSVSEFQADGGLNEIIESALELVPYI